MDSTISCIIFTKVKKSSNELKLRDTLKYSSKFQPCLSDTREKEGSDYIWLQGKISTLFHKFLNVIILKFCDA